ncbi:uncharacterized protein LTR77_010417 [Saxophila tyrrhenica]|uniref:Uncharacterized protein n=1 Tax=Saxophila tyrrhenica TaxID=1690608 RepID=A0AAV9NZ07_9PEZI|nr:hypothetical protein LTR77_010417 [Saxophila tyrrhenica]
MKLPFALGGEQQYTRRDNSVLEDGFRYGTKVVEKMTRTMVARSESTCKPGDDSAICEKPVSDTSSSTLPIVLGAVIPITCALCVFVYLHRRNKKKQALEDANDPHKSLDFGVEFTGQPKNKRGVTSKKGGEVPEMTITDLGPDPMRPNRAVRGMSMDFDSNPYLLPAGLHGSRESLHSMSRSMADEHDPYRPVTFVRSSNETSRSPRLFRENGSMYSSASTVQTGNEKSSLVANAQRMSQSFPKRGDSMSTSSPSDENPTRELHSALRGATPSRKTSLGSTSQNLADISESNPPPRNNSQKGPPPPLPPLPAEHYERTASPTDSSSRPPRKASLAAAALAPIDVRASDSSFYGDDVPAVAPPPPRVVEPGQEDYDIDPAQIYTGRFSIDGTAPSQQFPVQDNRMSVMGLRPLPPAAEQQENAEQRANRIRSFYKEYFDDSRPNPQQGVYEDYDPQYLDAAVYDPETGDYLVPQAPFAQPMGRRAMTPPPRGAAHFGGPDHSRHFSTMSGGRGPPRGRPAQRAPKKQLPPPKDLKSLPTPYMLREDTALIMNPIDFAPPTSFREHQNGRRPDSPAGIARPYSPAVKAYSPLVPAFDDLSAMPSPHHLRKSGTFTSLDFAPMPRFRGQEGSGASDAGSIRSARSGISAMQMDAVRAGAYRVSRIPKEYVTSRDDLAGQLRPKMNLISPA